MSSAHLIIVARHEKTGVLELPLDNLTLYGVGSEDRVLMNACARYGPDWKLSLYEPRGFTQSGTGAGELDPKAFISVDLADGPDRLVTWSYVDGAIQNIEIAPHNTAEMRWFDGRLEQKWIVYMAGHSTEEWRPVPAHRTAQGDKE